MMKTLYIGIQHENMEKAQSLAQILNSSHPLFTKYSLDIQAGKRASGLAVTTSHLGFVLVYSFDTPPIAPDVPLEVNTARQMREEYESLLTFSDEFEKRTLTTALNNKQFQITDPEQLERFAQWTTIGKQVNQNTLEQYKNDEQTQDSILQLQNIVNLYAKSPRKPDDTEPQAQYTGKSNLFQKKPSPNPMARHDTPSSTTTSSYGLLAGASALIGVAGIVFALEPVAWLIGLAILSASPPAFIAVVSIYALLVTASFVACAVFASKANEDTAQVPSMSY